MLLVGIFFKFCQTNIIIIIIIEIYQMQPKGQKIKN